MTKNRTNAKVDAYFEDSQKWRNEIMALREIILQFPLAEELKWGKPCYTFQENNVLILQEFNEHCALLFCKGALLNDPKCILVKPGENTQAARRIEFTSTHDVTTLAPALKTYIREAIEAEKSGKEVNYKKTTDFKIPGELQSKLEQNPKLKSAFAALTPGRQRAYLLYFSSAKQSKTRESRVEKHTPRILSGKGLDD